MRLITDSAADLTQELINQYDIRVMRMGITFGEENYIDEVNITKEEFYQKLKESSVLPITSQVTPYQFEEEYKSALEAGEEVLVITLSSELSGTYQSACIAKAVFEDDPRIHIIDSRTVTFGQGLLVKEAAEMIAQNLSTDVIVDEINKRIERCVLRGVIDTLTYLQKGGRLSAGEATLGTLLNVKPMIGIKDGKLEVIGKTRGTKKAIKKLIEELEDKKVDLSHKTVFMAHSNSPESVDELIKAIKEKFIMGEVVISNIGPIVGTHAGPGCFGFAYIE